MNAARTATQALLSKSIPMDVNGAVTVHALLQDVQILFNQSFDAYPLVQNATSNGLRGVRG